MMVNEPPSTEKRTVPLPRTSATFHLEVIAFWRLWWRHLGWGGMVAVAICTLLYIWWWLWAQSLKVDLMGYLAFGWPAAYGLLLILTQWWAMRRCCHPPTHWFRPPFGMPAKLELTFTSSGIDISFDDTLSGNNRSREIYWEDLTLLWQFSDCWMFVTNPGRISMVPTALTIPAHVLDPETRAFVANLLQKAGGMIAVNPPLGEGLMFKHRAFWLVIPGSRWEHRTTEG